MLSIPRRRIFVETRPWARLEAFHPFIVEDNVTPNHKDRLSKAAQGRRPCQCALWSVVYLFSLGTKPNVASQIKNLTDNLMEWSSFAEGRKSPRHVLVVLFLCLSGAVARAEEPFYADKMIEVLVSTESGTVYNAYAHLITMRLPDHLPGRPSVVLQNMPGGGGLRVATMERFICAAPS